MTGTTNGASTSPAGPGPDAAAEDASVTGSAMACEPSLLPSGFTAMRRSARPFVTPPSSWVSTGAPGSAYTGAPASPEAFREHWSSGLQPASEQAVSLPLAISSSWRHTKKLPSCSFGEAPARRAAGRGSSSSASPRSGGTITTGAIDAKDSTVLLSRRSDRTTSFDCERQNDSIDRWNNGLCAAISVATRRDAGRVGCGSNNEHRNPRGGAAQGWWASGDPIERRSPRAGFLRNVAKASTSDDDAGGHAPISARGRRPGA